MPKPVLPAADEPAGVLGARSRAGGGSCGTKVLPERFLCPVPPRRRAAECVRVDSSTVVEATAVGVSGSDPAEEATALLAVAADPVRWRLLTALAEAAHCVCELQPIGGVAPNLLSYHLRVLREAGLVSASRRGRWIDYALTGDALQRLHAALPVATYPASTGPRGCG